MINFIRSYNKFLEEKSGCIHIGYALLCILTYIYQWNIDGKFLFI